MRKLYTASFLLFCLLQISVRGHAQCVDGKAPTPVMMDTTIAFDPGVTTTQVKFPKFDPETGMIRCVKLTVTMTGVIDTVSMQNLSTSSSQWAKFTYVRNDQMTGPGLVSALSNSDSKVYGPYSVSKFDGDFSPAGQSHVSIPRDTVLQKTISRTLTDSTEISQFYGKDSVAYDYKIDVTTLANMSGGSSMNLVMTSALVNFKFEYCACAKVVLPIGLKNFAATKSGSNTATLSWEGENDGYQYNYDVEISRDGRHFSTVETVDRKYKAAPAYLYSFTARNNDFGKYFFRVRQHWQNGYVRYTPVKMVEFANPVFANISLYPNPSNGSAGIKFVNGRAGKMLVQVSTAGGQPVLSKELQVAETDYKVIGSLPTGLYWVKLTDLASKTSCVKQLLVQ